MGDSLFDDIAKGAVVAKHFFRGASKAYAKAKKAIESEKGQQIKEELRVKTCEAIVFASDKAKELGLEEKTKNAFGQAKEMIKGIAAAAATDYSPLSDEALAASYYDGKTLEIERRIAEASVEHERIMEELRAELANAPEYIEPDENGFFPEELPVTANVYEQMIKDEEERYESIRYNLQEELRQLEYERMDTEAVIAEQRRMEEEEEEERRRRENERDWDILMGKDPDRYY